MKLYPFVALLASFAFFGCAANIPPPPKPFMGIGHVTQLDNKPREYAQYEVVIRYENIVPEKYEVKIGFGYTTTDERLKEIAPGGHGFYAIAYSEVLHQPSGELKVTIEPTVVRNLHGTLDGKIHAILSPYPHGKEWLIAGHDIYVLPIRQ
jgi:hypothetical protein